MYISDSPSGKKLISLRSIGKQSKTLSWIYGISAILFSGIVFSSLPSAWREGNPLAIICVLVLGCAVLFGFGSSAIKGFFANKASKENQIVVDTDIIIGKHSTSFNDGDSSYYVYLAGHDDKSFTVGNSVVYHNAKIGEYVYCLRNVSSNSDKYLGIYPESTYELDADVARLISDEPLVDREMAKEKAREFYENHPLWKNEVTIHDFVHDFRFVMEGL